MSNVNDITNKKVLNIKCRIPTRWQSTVLDERWFSVFNAINYWPVDYNNTPNCSTYRIENYLYRKDKNDISTSKIQNLLVFKIQKDIEMIFLDDAWDFEHYNVYIKFYKIEEITEDNFTYSFSKYSGFNDKIEITKRTDGRYHTTIPAGIYNLNGWEILLISKEDKTEDNEYYYYRGDEDPIYCWTEEKSQPRPIMLGNETYNSVDNNILGYSISKTTIPRFFINHKNIRLNVLKEEIKYYNESDNGDYSYYDKKINDNQEMIFNFDGIDENKLKLEKPFKFNSTLIPHEIFNDFGWDIANVPGESGNDLTLKYQIDTENKTKWLTIKYTNSNFITQVKQYELKDNDEVILYKRNPITWDLNNSTLEQQGYWRLYSSGTTNSRVGVLATDRGVLTLDFTANLKNTEISIHDITGNITDSEKSILNIENIEDNQINKEDYKYTYLKNVIHRQKENEKQSITFEYPKISPGTVTYSAYSAYRTGYRLLYSLKGLNNKTSFHITESELIINQNNFQRRINLRNIPYVSLNKTMHTVFIDENITNNHRLNINMETTEYNINKVISQYTTWNKLSVGLISPSSAVEQFVQNDVHANQSTGLRNMEITGNLQKEVGIKEIDGMYCDDIPNIGNNTSNQTGQNWAQIYSLNRHGLNQKISMERGPEDFYGNGSNEPAIAIFIWSEKEHPEWKSINSPMA